ncbi:hypothetical protein [Arthrobacter sp. fls2-241-R2A-172]|uniref:lipopolysaccharide biosynthesis protein n=1 Tax=Arthrobacter sp. fls2-241-R2A-172 TaxID=3040325 RepID=UPI00254C18C7|nr:hypothetical protein [Arthrobacter sp. fls2-241-R2A-172]
MPIRPRAERRDKAPADDVKIAENSGFLAVSAGIVGVVSYACTLLMANMLGTADYTLFAAAAMILGVVGIVANALVPLPLSHVVAVHPEGSRERQDGVAFSVFVSFLAGLLAATVTGTVTLALATPALAAAVALAALAIFIVNAPAGWLQGELRFRWYAASTIGEVVLRLLFSLLVIVMAWGAGGAVLGFVVACFAPLVVPRSFYRDLRWRPRVLLDRWRWAETSDIASVLCVVSVLVGVDVVVVGFLDNGSAAAAGFQALATIAKGPVYVAAGTALVAFPLLRTPGARTEEVLRASFASFGQLVVVAFAIIATAPPVMAGIIVPPKYHGSLQLLPWLAASGLGYAVLMVLSTILLAMRAYRRCQLGLACSCLLVVGGLWAGWQLDAVTGLAVGSAAGAVLSGVVLVVLAWPVLTEARPGKGAGQFILLAAGLIVVLAVASWLQPLLWLVLAGISGVAVLAHQRNLLPHKNDFRMARRRPAGDHTGTSGRRSTVKTRPTWAARALAGNLTAFIVVVAAAFGLTLRFGEGMEAAFQFRWLDAVMGAVGVGLCFLVARRLSSTAAAWLAAVVVIVEPLLLRIGNPTFLEASGMVAALAAPLLLTGPGAGVRAGWQSFLKPAGAGVLLGYCAISLDVSFIWVVAPVIVATVWKRTLSWRQAVMVTGFAVVLYADYVMVAATHGYATGHGFQGVPRIAKEVIELSGTGHALLVWCALAGVVLCFSGHAGRRLLGLGGLALGASGAWTALLGTLTEEFVYAVAVAGAICGAVMVVELAARFSTASKVYRTERQR